MHDSAERTRIAFFGLGYLGCVAAACLARLGHSVVGVDSDPRKVDSVRKGRAPFYEPGLEEIIEKAVGDGSLSVSESAHDALKDADIAMVCVGTPPEPSGDLGLGQLRRVAGDIASSLAPRKKPLVVAIRSTVFPGTCEEVVVPAFAHRPEVSVVAHPEFLREGCAVRDFMEPQLLVVGGADASAARRVAGLYAPLNVEPRLVSWRTAEMIKYACNSFHAIKAAFANEIGAVCDRLSIDGQEVMELLCQDRKLNVSPAYLRPGLAFGGSCLRKDVRALTYRAAHLNLKLPLLESALPSNDRQLERNTDSVFDLQGRLGVIGLAFKESTDDLRESAVVAMLESLTKRGREVRVYDPHIRSDSSAPSGNPHIARMLQTELDALLAWADHLVVTQRPDSTLAGRIALSGLPVLDLVGCGLGKAATERVSLQ